MNKNFYRIIFNKVRGLSVVVSEIVKSHQVVVNNNQRTKMAEKNVTRQVQPHTLKSLVFLSYIALGMVSIIDTSYANNIVVDQNANQTQRPTVQGLPNGATQIDIAAPSSNGVSHNKYTQFDVSKNGVILNNSPDGSQTQLAGNINGNASLQNSAKVILNEVNSQNISQLNGYIEVAGQKAQVVIANPAGITCNGCGFINADRATLTTGKPIIEDGKLTGYQVEKGQIAITGEGLKNSGQDYTDLIARSVSVNAELWANKEINIVTGKAKVSADLTKIEKVASATNTEQPEFALDVSALGGMYAGKIKMVGTEAGVGVRNNGILMASAGTIDISTNGKILNTVSGNLNSATDTLLKSDNIENHGTIISQKNVILTGKTEVKNYGIVNAKEDINLKAEKLVANENRLLAGNNLSAESEEFLSTWTGNVSANNITLNAAQTKNVGKINAAESVKIKASSVENAGNLSAGESITVSSDQIKNDWFGVIQSKNIELEGTNLENYKEINATDNLTIKVGNINNINTLTSDNKLTLESQNIQNHSTGLIQSQKELSIKSKILSNNGVLASIENMNIISDDVFNHWNGTMQSKIVDLKGNNFRNYGAVNGVQSIDIAVKGILYNQGILSSISPEPSPHSESSETPSFKINLSFDSFKNDWNGKVNADQINLVNIKTNNDQVNETGEFINYNEMNANDLLNIDVKNVYNQGKLLAKNDLSITSDNFKNDWKGEVQANNIALLGEKFDNYNQVIANSELNINVKNAYNQAKLLTKGKLLINSDNFKNDWLGEINSNSIEITGNKFDNRNKLIADDIMNINLNDFYNNGELVANKQVKVVSHNLKNDWFGSIKAENIDLNVITNMENFGEVEAGDQLTINANNTYNQGNVTSKREIKLSGNRFVNDWHGVIKAEIITDNLPDKIINHGLINGKSTNVKDE